jgi:hypothetical protein
MTPTAEWWFRTFTTYMIGSIVILMIVATFVGMIVALLFPKYVAPSTETRPETDEQRARRERAQARLDLSARATGMAMAGSSLSLPLGLMAAILSAPRSAPTAPAAEQAAAGDDLEGQEPGSVRAGVLPDGRACLHLGETANFCTKCWTNLYEERRRWWAPTR